jgi:hypothetical protein
MGEFSILVPFALMPNALTVSGGSLQNYLRTREELMQRANDVIAGIRAGWLKLNIGRVLPLVSRCTKLGDWRALPFEGVSSFSTIFNCT